MLEKLENCPICNSRQLEEYLQCKDYTVSGEIFSISTCTSCKTKFTNPRPAPQEIGRYYESKDYISHSNSSSSLIDHVYKIVRNYTLYSKYKLISKYQAEKGTLLDYGCGTGHFLKKMKEKGWGTIGIEPNEQARTLSQKNSIQVHENFEKIDVSKKFDAITLWHVLEHVHHPTQILRSLKDKLSENGMMYVAVPNEASYDALTYKKYWAAFDVPRHLFHFNQESFKEVVKRSNLSIQEVVPMKFDSFYVSMLSEKNKYKRNNFIQAFKTGYISNIWANNNNNNFSSLIYIIKK